MIVRLLILAILVYAAVICAYKIKDAITARQPQRQLPSRSFGKLEPRKPLDTHRLSKLLRNAGLIMQLLNWKHGALPETEAKAKRWLDEYRNHEFIPSDQVAQAGTILLEAESELRLLKLIDEDVGRQTTDWLDEYLDRGSR